MERKLKIYTVLGIVIVLGVALFLPLRPLATIRNVEGHVSISTGVDEAKVGEDVTVNCNGGFTLGSQSYIGSRSCMYGTLKLYKNGERIAKNTLKKCGFCKGCSASGSISKVVQMPSKDMTLKCTVENVKAILYDEPNRHFDTVATGLKTVRLIPTYCRSDADCVWCGDRCVLEPKREVMDCPTVKPPENAKCSCNMNEGSCKVLKDSDGDGVFNKNDTCPHTFGSDPQGCPLYDEDNDGVFDRNDKCPSEAGSSSDGCPNIIEQIVHILFGWAGLQNWMM